MRRFVVLFALFLTLTAAAIPTSLMYDGLPPARFDKPHKMQVVYGRVDECGKPNVPDHPNAYFEACVRHGVTFLPDPCAYGERETFARLACHEAAHVRGWPATHGE